MIDTPAGIKPRVKETSQGKDQKGRRPMYRIVEWETNFENNRTKELKKLTWVPFPNRHDGDGYTELLDHPNGPAHFGAWCAICQVASKCDPRGTLSRDGARPHTASSLARMTKIPETLMREAIARLVNPVRWLEIIPDPTEYEGVTEIPQEDATTSHFPASRVRAQEGNGREWKGMEQKGKEGSGAADAAGLSPEADTSDVRDPELRDWLRWWNSLKGELLVPAGVNEEEPSQGVVKAWKRVKRHTKDGRQLRKLLADRDAIEREIRASSFLRQGWFRLEKLFGGTNREGEFVLAKLLDGGYRDGACWNSPASDDPRGTMATASAYLESRGVE